MYPTQSLSIENQVTAKLPASESGKRSKYQLVKVNLTFICSLSYWRDKSLRNQKRFDTPLLIDVIKLVRNQPVCNSRSSSIVIEAPFVLITAILRRQRRAQFLTDPYTLSRAQESYHFSWHWKLTDVHPVDPNVQSSSVRGPWLHRFLATPRPHSFPRRNIPQSYVIFRARPI